MLRRLLGPALLISAAAFSPRAHAEDAQALFDEGLSDMRAGRFKLGCALIKQSLDIDARPGTLFTLAECYSKAGKYASAVAHYDRYLTVYETMPADQKQSQQARAELSQSERTRLVALVAWITVNLPGNAPPGVVVTMDGEPFSTSLFGIATAVDPGPRIFTTRAPDGPLIEQRFDIGPGERRSLTLALKTSESTDSEVGEPPRPPPDEDVPPGTSTASSKHSLSPWFWVAGGVGAAGLVTGAVTGVMLLDARSTIKSDCDPSRKDQLGRIPCTKTGSDAASLAQGTLAPITTVALGVGVVGVATAVAILLSGDSSSTASRGAVPTVLVGPGLASVGVNGAF